MKGIKLIFSIALALCISHVAAAEEETDTARAATLRTVASTVVSSNRQQTSSTNSTQQNKVSTGVSRLSGASGSTSSTQTATTEKSNERAVNARTTSVVKDSSGARSATGDNSSKVITARTASNVLPRATTSQNNVVVESAARSAVRNATTPSRTGTNAQTSSGARSALSISRAATTPSRAASNITTEINNVRRNLSTTTASGRLSRSATTTAAEEVLSSNYEKCREVYNSCMDEFCANKDSQLKRCACSSRINEFDGLKAQLTEVEDKLLDFNQRLLTVNMEKEDAEALYQATEGELAFNTEDESESKKMLDEIAEKLNTTFADSTQSQNLSPISLSLNVDAAFDSVDSLMGASTTTKSGTELYSAALPVCREMALEVCSQDELDIAESGYQMLIEQDCNTVAKTYETQQDQARAKIYEGSALLDMSRLSIYQQRNSDDILTCKKKMLDMLTDSSVCGEGLGKCLDISGKYIDPSTGEAILTTNLAELASLIVRPDANQTWTNAPGNSKFVTYLNSKKKFLEPAMENCQDIADNVWDAFIEDALAQIKLAQESKLEEVRQGCTTLTTQCLTDAAKSIEDFDARALSIFGVQADKTVKEMCAQVQNACTALLNTTDGGDIWEEGMTEIATDKTYETILSTCREVGRSCIIQSCKSISGNFGLCENIQNSVNRKSIINRRACWDEVVQCVADAGVESIDKIMEKLQSTGVVDDTYAFYKTLYGTNVQVSSAVDVNSCISAGTDANCVYDICEKECGLRTSDNELEDSTAQTTECKTCRLSERVWGNCEVDPTTDLPEETSHNRIRQPLTGTNDTLLSWFATNTNTDDALDSCRDTSCSLGYKAYYDEATGTTMCISKVNISDDGEVCPTQTFWRVPITNTIDNCCKQSDDPSKAGSRDVFGNCCTLSETTETIDGLDWGIAYNSFKKDQTTPIRQIGTDTEQNISVPAEGLCLPSTTNKPQYVVSVYTAEEKALHLLCINGVLNIGVNTDDAFPNGKDITCEGGYFIVINKTDKTYSLPKYSSNPGTLTLPLSMYYKTNSQNTCTMLPNGTTSGTNCPTEGRTGKWVINPNIQNTCTLNPSTNTCNPNTEQENGL